MVILKFVDLMFLVILTPTHLAIVMEYASGGELFEWICNAEYFHKLRFALNVFS